MISVIIPCYNCEDYISRAVDSVFKQTYTDWELILVNNNSKDGTQTILDDYQRKHPDRISVFIETKPGAPAARNCGLRNAKGDWIQFLDADDELMADKFERHLKLCQINDAVVIAGTFLRKEGDTKKIITPGTDNVWLSLIKTQLGITSANFWQKDNLLALNGFNENMSSSQEYDLLFRSLSKYANFAFDNQVSAIVHINENSISHPKSKGRLKEVLLNWLELRNNIRTYLTNNGMFDRSFATAYHQYAITILKWYQNFLGYFYIRKLKKRYRIEGRVDFSVRRALRDIKLYLNNQQNS